MRNLLALALIGICLIVASLAHAGTQVTAFWDAPEIITTPESTNAPDGYNVYLGTESGNYPDKFDAGNLLYYTLDLEPGVYYAAVKAYNSSGESDNFSPEGSIEIKIVVIRPGDVKVFYLQSGRP